MSIKINKDQIIAAAVTFVVALLLLLFLFFCGMSYDRQELARVSTPELMAPDEEELFLEPEILRDLGEEDATVKDAPAPSFKGEPEKAQVENTKLVVPDKKPKPAPPVEKPVTQKTESPVKATTPSATEEEKKKVTSAMTNKFSSTNGTKDGKTGSAGAGGSGVGYSGVVSGRTFKGLTPPSGLSLQRKVTVVVKVTIDAAGKVTSAKARPGSGASATIIAACEKAARTASWTEKKDTPSASGSITFTIIPR